MSKYPHPCTRCGYCCLAVTCPIGVAHYGNVSPCPGLTFEDGVATCALADPGPVPVGDGCCIKATAIKDGVAYDFAALPEDIKRLATADLKRLKEASDA